MVRGCSLLVQWLGLGTSNAGTWVQKKKKKKLFRWRKRGTELLYVQSYSVNLRTRHLSRTPAVLEGLKFLPHLYM